MALITDIFTFSALTISGGASGGDLIGDVQFGADSEDGGTYLVAGTTVLEGTPDTPVYRKVRLMDLACGRLVREVWSDPVTGAFSFPHVRRGPYFLTTHDHTGGFNAVIADNVTGVAE